MNKYKNNRFFTFHFSLFTFHFLCVLVSLCLCAFLSGCSTVKKIQHLPQLLTIKNYSDSQDRLAKEVEASDQLFDEMVAEIEAGAFHYVTDKEIFKRFGAPVFKREAEYQGKICEQWLYRKAKDFSGENGKVYVYFDSEKRLVDFEHIKGNI